MSIIIDAALVEGALGRTLENMCFACVLNTQQDWDAEEAGQSAAIRFSGDWNGWLWLQAPESTCSALAASFLGEDELQIDVERSRAVLGELANMVCGSLLGHANPNGHFDLASPDLSGPGPANTTYDQAFELDCGSLRVAVVLQ